MPLEPLLTQIRACQVCASALPLGANPVVQAHSEAKILIIGQAPGTKVHHSSIPWNDASGNRLRAWLDIEKQTFYDPKQIAIMPMGFCYPGQGQSGDLPPRKECAPLWHEALLKHLPNIELTLLIGQYAQNRYLSNKPKTLTETVQNWQAWLPDYLPLPHPSPRNTLWLRKNPWFEEQTVPYLRQQVHQRLSLSKVAR
ncbi:uracil-DNA glycosylase family protein [Vibrio vulnificus]|nr:uracil-DNA glycosylase family protein [Vibrio vulnificus]EIZ1007436.1 uracil-DNA glycosylase family protein [Vibrio vulnificus]EIZ1173231.1 uracil-DNA glycosylase family protein [Vibrio vulnificus]EKG2462001.1 uracil-DNA glycosylase family protein [Vibrio vulnificus]HAS8432694.1 uracil-DNA glycosylase family protein [Vibrio vulnificus]